MPASQKSSSSEWLELPVGPSPVQSVRLVGRLQRQAGFRSVASSLPGHLVQLTIAGQTAQEIGGRRYALRPGSLVWFHEDESVRGEVLQGPLVFYTVNFIAPSLAPPPFEARVRQVGRTVRQQFARLLTAWEDTAVTPAVRTMRVHAILLDLLSRLEPSRSQPFGMDPPASLWWNLETHLRRDLSAKTDLVSMAAHAGRSVATLTRSCRAAVATTPMKRLKQIRLSLARGLVRRSGLSFSAIAARIGYDRVHEFSRDYRKYFGVTATVDRQR